MAQQKAHVSEQKKKNVSELSELAKSNKTILLVSIKGIPASQYQEIVKKFRGKAVIKVPKKSSISRALESQENEGIKKLKEYVGDSMAILFSDDDAFDISAELLNKKTAVGAKAGQEAPEDIIVQPGPTELLPGPAISELGAVGIQIQIDKGKIAIKAEKTIVKKGEKISSAVADVMNKLNIKPFSIGFIPVAAFDAETGKIYIDIQIDREKTLEELKQAFGRALSFAVGIAYVNEDTIKFLLGKAAAHGKALEKFESAPELEEKEEVKEESSEEVKEETVEEVKAEEKSEKKAEEEHKNKGDKNGTN
ncbi:MAG: 50S ribosomal protein L10 [Nanoarchaeota archaeon]|nr:50S ribosomal protein L10 [Nanoarchaeota archaeon]